MLKSIKTYFALAGILVLLSTACNGPAAKNGNDEDRILERPPFAAVTDSIRQFPGEAGLYFRRGDLLSRNDRHEIAVEDFKKAWGLHPDEETGLRYASTLSILNKPTEAIKLLQDCIQKFPTNNAFEKLLGEIYTQSGQTGKAMKLFDTMLNADSTNFEAWYEKGLLLEQTGDTAGAIISLKKASSIEPIVTYSMELAHIYAESRNKLALQLCDEAIRKDSSGEMTDPFFIKGIYYSNMRQYSAAIPQFDSCIRRDWTFTEAYIEKGIAFFKEKNYQEALKIFTMAAAVTNTDPDAYFWMGRCYEADNKKDEAIQNYQRAISLDKGFTEARAAIERVKKSYP